MDVLATASDEVLYLYLAAGDGTEAAEAWCEVARRHGREILGMCLKRSSRVKVPDAEDILQETLLAAAKDFDSFDPAVGSFRAWLFGIASHRLHDWLRHGSRKKRAGAVQLEDDDRRVIDGPPVDRPVDVRLDTEELRTRLRTLAADLDSVDRDILETFMRGDMDPDQQRRIAECHGMPLGTVRVRQTRLLQRLREPLRDYAPFGRHGGAS